MVSIANSSEVIFDLNLFPVLSGGMLSEAENKGKALQGQTRQSQVGSQYRDIGRLSTGQNQFFEANSPTPQTNLKQQQQELRQHQQQRLRQQQQGMLELEVK